MTELWVQVKTALGPPGPDEYFDGLERVEYEKYSDGTIKEARIGLFESIDDLYNRCDYDSIVVSEPAKFDFDEADLVATVYDGYIE